MPVSFVRVTMPFQRQMVGVGGIVNVDSGGVDGLCFLAEVIEEVGSDLWAYEGSVGSCVVLTRSVCTFPKEVRLSRALLRDSVPVKFLGDTSTWFE